MKNMFKKLSVFLAAVLCVSCMFAGFVMAEEAAADTEGQSDAGQAIEQLIGALGTALSESSSDESVDAESADAESTDAESADAESADAESADAEGATEDADSAGDSTGESDGESMAAMLEMFGIEFDAEAFEEELNAKIEAGEEVTLEDCMPQEYFDLMNMFMNISFSEDEEAPYVIEMGVIENELYYSWTFTDVVSEEDCAEVVASVAESFESDETKAELMESMEKMAESYPVDIYDMSESIYFFNGDDSVIYEMTYTYEMLEEELGEEVEEILEEVDAE